MGRKKRRSMEDMLGKECMGQYVEGLSAFTLTKSKKHREGLRATTTSKRQTVENVVGRN